MPVALRHFFVAIVFSSLAACGGAVRDAPPVASAPAVTTPDPKPQARSGTRYAIDSEASELRVLVYRGGTLAHLGHNHVISSRALRGDLLLAEPTDASRLTMVLPLNSLVVDDPALRAEEGDNFPDDIPPSAREGTRRNMLGEELLDAARFPDITLSLTGVRGTPPELLLSFDVRVRGQARQLELPVTLQTGGNSVTASGQTQVTHAQLGLTPFSALLGALRVEERIDLKYRVVATRQDAGTTP